MLLFGFADGVTIERGLRDGKAKASALAPCVRGAAGSLWMSHSFDDVPYVSRNDSASVLPSSVNRDVFGDVVGCWVTKRYTPSTVHTRVRAGE